MKTYPENQEANLDKTIDSLTASSLPYYNSIFKQLAKSNPKNAQIVCDFITMEYNEQNMKLGTRLVHIKIICSFLKYLRYKDFQQITKTDVLLYLNSLRKTESADPTHKWIGTFNTRQMVLSKFFRWLYNQNEPDHDKWLTPPCMHGLEYDEFKSVRTKKTRSIRSDKEAEALLPLMMIDDAKKKTKLYSDLDSLRVDLKKFDEEYRKSNIRIIERQFSNLNDYFL